MRVMTTAPRVMSRWTILENDSRLVEVQLVQHVDDTLPNVRLLQARADGRLHFIDLSIARLPPLLRALEQAASIVAPLLLKRESELAEAQGREPVSVGNWQRGGRREVRATFVPDYRGSPRLELRIWERWPTSIATGWHWLIERYELPSLSATLERARGMWHQRAAAVLGGTEGSDDAGQ